MFRLTLCDLCKSSSLQAPSPKREYRPCATQFTWIIEPFCLFYPNFACCHVSTWKFRIPIDRSADGGPPSRRPLFLVNAGLSSIHHSTVPQLTARSLLCNATSANEHLEAVHQSFCAVVWHHMGVRNFHVSGRRSAPTLHGGCIGIAVRKATRRRARRVISHLYETSQDRSGLSQGPLPVRERGPVDEYI